jgi:hypothetical protein
MPESSVLARWLFLAGLGLILLAGAISLLNRFDINLGELPGDIKFQREGFSCFIPLASSLLLSAILTVLINLILRSMRK